ncbi:hypothetical protein PYW07_006304 [Mythimna separata]|uniref:Zinc finger PHD-type domain-containing protein n=1 Tax=Mythimna separata TaxID=271217 RepID=A0AAD7YUM4_MYTSE|nr:hypothetical protein PYW07_006304 [Mythimna separata]
MQPLDRGFHGVLKKFYSSECEKWLRNHPGRSITVYQVAAIFTPAFYQAATTGRGIELFKCTGIVPWNPEIFTDADFLASEVTEREDPENNPVSQSFPQEPLVPAVIDLCEDTPSIISAPQAPTVSDETVEVELPQPGFSGSTSTCFEKPATLVVKAKSDLQYSSTTSVSRDPTSSIVSSAQEADVPNKTFEADPPHLSSRSEQPESSCSEPQPESSHSEPQPESSRSEPTPESTRSEPQPESFRSEPQPESFRSEPQPWSTSSVKPSPVTEARSILQISSSPLSDIIPFPKSTQKRSFNRKHKKTEVISSSPYKIQLEKENEEKNKKNKSKGAPKAKKMKRVHKKPKINNTKKIWRCGGCSEIYKEPIEEDWIACDKCKVWWHENCSDYNGSGAFVCDLCK